MQQHKGNSAAEDWQCAAEQILARCEQLATLSEMDGGLTRVYLSEQHRQANAQVAEWMREAGMQVHQDGAGNIIGRYEGGSPDAPALLLGSHLDSVRNAGKYDGMLGVISAIEVVAALHRCGERLPFAIEVIGFGDEEGVRFGITLLGSRALAGGWPAEWLQQADADGIPLERALAEFGLDPEAVGSARRDPAGVLAYVELHIEQGPQLEEAGQPLAVVSAINGARRLKLALTGMAGHAGTVPMALRRDALCGFSELALAVERLAQEHEAVATIGQLQCHPGATNVIPGKVSFTLDVRAPENGQRDALLAEILAEANEIAARRELEFSQECFYEADATPCALWLLRQLAEAVTAEQGTKVVLASGAGHDAIAMAGLCPVGMLFVRCKEGISHHPAESVTLEDVSAGFNALLTFVRGFRSEGAI